MKPLPDFLQPLEFTTVPFPREAMEAAVARRDESIPYLLESLDWVDRNPEEANEVGRNTKSAAAVPHPRSGRA